MASTPCDRACPSDFSRKLEVNTTELVTKIAEAHSVSKSQAQAIVDSMLKTIISAAAKGEEISLPGFGKFKVKDTPEREGRNPTSGEKIKIAASRKLTYSPAKAVKELLNS
jgi:DNA-binding protein HU-beta